MIRAMRSISSTRDEDYEIEISDCLVELVENLIIKRDIKDLFEKSSSAENTFIAIQIICCLTNFQDRQPTSFSNKFDRHRRELGHRSKESSK